MTEIEMLATLGFVLVGWSIGMLIVVAVMIFWGRRP